MDKIQPHHHVTVWSAVVLIVILAATFYTNAILAYEGQQGPSQETEEFFGGPQKETGSIPPECQQTQQQTQYSPQDLGVTQEQFNSMTEEQKRQLYEQKSGQQQSSFESTECRAAMIKQIRAEMSDFRDKLKSGEISSKLDKVLEIIKKLQEGTDGGGSGLQQLKDAGVDTSAIEALLQPIIDDAKTLKNFFNDMIALLDKFFSIVDPNEAFTYLENEFKPEKFEGMGNVADRLVSNITKLQAELEKVAGKLP